jgi:hypothetical protein
MTEELIFPTVHLNGTSQEDLAAGYMKAMEAVRAARESLSWIEFNARDYYPQGPGAWTEAREQMTARHATLERMAEDLERITIHILDNPCR